MNSRPEQHPQPVQFNRPIEQLLADAEHNVVCHRIAYESAKTQARQACRRRNRARRLAVRRAALRYGRRTARAGLLLCGLVAFIAGVVLLVLRAPGSIELFSTAGAAWGLAAALPRRS